VVKIKISLYFDKITAFQGAHGIYFNILAGTVIYHQREDDCYGILFASLGQNLGSQAEIKMMATV
jgi:hypothetical protein